MKTTVDITFDRPLSPEQIARLQEHRDAEDRITTQACAHIPSEVLQRGDLKRLAEALRTLGAMVGPQPAAWLPEAERAEVGRALGAALGWKQLARSAPMDAARVQLCRLACRFAPLEAIEEGLIQDLVVAGLFARRAVESWGGLTELERQMLGQEIDRLCELCGEGGEQS